MMKTTLRRLQRAWIPGTIAFLALATASLGQVHTNVAHPQPSMAPIVVPTMHASPIVAPSMSPMALPTIKSLAQNYVGVVRPGQRIPLSRLPHLPMKTAFNTIVPGRHKHGGRFHPMAATGASLTVTAAASCATGGTVGQLFNVGCQLTIGASSMASWGTGPYQYYVVPPNSTTATEFGATGCTPAITDPWTAAQSPSCTGTSTLLSAQGTYAFFAYDTATKTIGAIVFVNAGQVFTIQVFQDAFHTTQAYQFDTTTSPAAYIYLQNVAPSDYYVTYIYSTGVNGYCVYMSPGATPPPPSPSPRPTGGAAPGNLVCNPNNSSGVQAPGGNLSVTWNFNPNNLPQSPLEAGSYQIVVYDKSANQGAGQTLGSVQVALTVYGGAAILTEPTLPPAATNPSPGPNGPASQTVMAWDNSNDQSAGGITAATQQAIPAGTYVWTISDPQGQVVSSATVTAPAPTHLPQSFNFPATLSPPGQYPSRNWVVQLFDPVAKQVKGSQSFQVYGYHVTTQFDVNDAGTLSQVINFSTSPAIEEVTAGLRFTNDGNVIYGEDSDTIGQGLHPAIVFTTGRQDSLSDAYPPLPVGCNGCNFAGVTVDPNGSAGHCETSPCTINPVTDSNGNNWTANIYCSVDPASNPGDHGGAWDQCVITLTPNSASTILPTGSYIEIPDLQWYGVNSNSAWPCYSTPCYATTSVLPTHGLAWSRTNNLNSPVAWTPVAFGGFNAGITVQGTARVDYAGSQTSGGSNRNFNATQGQIPWTDAHYYQSYFTRAGYQNSTPFAPPNRQNVVALEITNFSVGNTGEDAIVPGSSVGEAANPEIAIGFPSYFTASQIQLDSQSTSGANSWATATCPSTFGPQYVCFNGTGTNSKSIKGADSSPAGSSVIYLDLPLPVSSFTAQEITAQAFSQDELYFSLANDATAMSGLGFAQPGNSNENTVDGQQTFDSLKIAAWSLNGALMSAAFNPPTVPALATNENLNIVVQNASTSSDPNPDSLDAIVIEEQGGAPSASYGAVAAGTTVTTTQGNWTYLGSVTSSHPVANTIDYWFAPSSCKGLTNWANVSGTGGPPQSAGVAFPLTAQYPSMQECTGATGSAKALLGNGTNNTATINLQIAGPIAAGTQTWYMYAHGANGGGWSQPKSFNVAFSNESANSGFSAIAPLAGSCGTFTSVATNAQPQIGTSSNCYRYLLTNTSATQTIGKFFITLPAFDINGLSAVDTSGNPWKLVTPVASTITLSGTGASSCSVNTGATNTFNPNPGVSNGQIEIDCGSGLAAGKNVTVQFEATSPNVQNDTYQFPAYLETAGTGTPAGQTWIGDQSIQVSNTAGLTVTVDPQQPSTGGSTPVVQCTPCAFSGATIDFGAITNEQTVTGTDVVKASVIYTGATKAGTDWNLTVSTSGNPACQNSASPSFTCAGGAPLSELLFETDSGNSGTQLGKAGCNGGGSMSYLNNSSFVPITSGGQGVANGPETQCENPTTGSPYPFEVIQNYLVQVGQETISGHQLTVTYTVVFN